MIDTILHGDCLDEMKLLNESSIDMIYLDPPFFTEKRHKLKNRERTKEFSFDDIWGSDREYAEFLKERIEVMHSRLKDTGSIFVHCDKSGEHIVRAILDQVFGAENFQSEIIWSYKRWSNSKKGLLPSHQNIYFYSKTKKFKFNKIYTNYSETTNVDQILQRRRRDEHNKSIYDRDSDGNIINGDKKKGVPLSDVWDIPYLNPKAKERVGYPTQKPLLLLEQIIKLVTDEGDLVLDPFCGSGTTCVAAKLENRRFLGIDQSADAVELANSRLDNPIKTESNLVKKGRASYRNSDESALALLKGIEFNAVQRNKGIDAILMEQYQNTPILVRVQKENESLSDAASLLSNAMKVKKSLRSILIQTALDDGMFEVNVEGMEIIQAPSLLISKAVGL
ncbi:site-specific DNA-methyltransferase [Vibrio parahaemolyticus]|uniref:DNA-methyltransferase n=1 Tax=Vibrio parahaemolyticus TaxID=670 RepID=UPI0003FC140D|nr:site-specific DNA-methyltransferase [Vibrio parahaemolyticus]EJB1785477.1 site-specific DNA-methyltransferase [Vibrio parahaemolyticus]EJG0690368.1 site-specific DNA-methyltransferase [Vibrio parahaemolyticus]EJG0972751.1 site-specific DNA-methyltransferase [Vibrio parahaemolyticus]ELA9812985.1 site-specific DNA-methyltransferase [Vibrio parahaemolyticus]ELA9888183.1 site-specific DNA-methyltransferase [Vibrio parahaemolyticus]